MDDYKYWRSCVRDFPDLFPTAGTFKYELSAYRDDWRESGVIVEAGTGEQRKRVLVSPSRYVNFWKQRTKRGAA